MTDFFQNGVISTLPKIKDRPLDELEDALRRYSGPQGIVLVLPALYSEFEGEAMPHIVEELKGADYLHRIVLSLDRATEEEFRRVKETMSVLPVPVSILWNDGPRIRRLLDTLRQADFHVAAQGKGRGVWMAIGLALTDTHTHTIALHDCDIVSYRREMLARLVYPIVHPGTDFEFSKGYYARANGKLYGRVVRLFYTPLVRALKRLMHHSRFLDYLDSFRYPLSGEFAFIRSLAKGIRISPSWGLEVSLLGEVYEKTTVQRVCQVEIAHNYEHKHRELSKDDPKGGLARMASEIAATLFRVLAQGGNILSKAFFDSLSATYLQHAQRAIEQFDAVASINGLAYDRHAELEAVEVFADALRRAQESFRKDPVGTNPMAPWVQVRSALPDFASQLSEAAAADNA